MTAHACSYDAGVHTATRTHRIPHTPRWICAAGYQNLNKHPTWQVTLSELFPFLKQIQLPLYCMKDQLSIEIHFSDEARRYWLRHAVGVPAAALTSAGR